jgi:hypothetical protein
MLPALRRCVPIWHGPDVTALVATQNFSDSTFHQYIVRPHRLRYLGVEATGLGLPGHHRTSGLRDATNNPVLAYVACHVSASSANHAAVISSLMPACRDDHAVCCKAFASVPRLTPAPLDDGVDGPRRRRPDLSVQHSKKPVGCFLHCARSSSRIPALPCFLSLKPCKHEQHHYRWTRGWIQCHAAGEQIPFRGFSD